MSKISDSKTFRHIYVVYRRVQLHDMKLVWLSEWMGPKVQYARDYIERSVGKFKIVKYAKVKE